MFWSGFMGFWEEPGRNLGSITRVQGRGMGGQGQAPCKLNEAQGTKGKTVKCKVETFFEY